MAKPTVLLEIIPLINRRNIMTQEMTVKKDLKCVFNMPTKISSEFDGDEEISHYLPPYAPVDVHPVDEYEACPTNWMHGSDMVSSYFVGVKEDHGMWIDFNECSYHTHDVAIVISIQGINPITGQKMVADKALRLEQYHKKCPIHNTNFKQDRYCEKCGFKWPGQNYLATTGTPEMKLWLDGFRTPDGKVRQYIFTEDKVRGVAAQLIGEERVFAVGIAYYLSKHKKPYTSERPKGRSMSGNFGGSPLICNLDGWNKYGDSGSPILGIGETLSSNSGDIVDNVDFNFFAGDSVEIGNSVGNISCNNIGATAGMTPKSTKGVGHIKASKSILRAQASVSPSMNVQPVTPVKKLEIGAGALIKQRVYDDPKMMSYWEEKPAGMIYINYCDEETKKKILDGGRRADKKDGFMKDIKVGG
ncbi:MAG: hypothetical protein DRO11_09970 [Methanobacteriota archaeon]|nr:MAG: hypothetical protein DRO11_09970 [Euryarchaeota archaeon]